MRTLNLLSIVSDAEKNKYNFHIRTSSPLHTPHLSYALHPNIIQTNAYQLDGGKSLRSLQDFDSSHLVKEEIQFLKQNSVKAIISDALSLPCQLGDSLNIPSILITNFTFDSIFQALLDDAPSSTNKEALKLKVDEMSQQYALAHTVIRLPGYISSRFEGPQIIDAPMHFRKAKHNREETLAILGLKLLEGKKILLHCFGGHSLNAPSELPELPEGWASISQTIDCPPLFNKISHDVYMPDLIGASDAVLGKLGWGTCSEVIGNGCKPFIYVPRSAFIEEAGLLSWMETAHRRTIRLEVEKYESSDWQRSIEEAQEIGALIPELEVDWAKNDAESIRILTETLDSALS